MANHKSAIKRLHRNKKRQEINGNRTSRIRTFLKKVEAAIASGDANQAQDAFNTVQPELMRGAAKGVLPKNTVSRKLSRLSARIKAIRAA